MIKPNKAMRELMEQGKQARERWDELPDAVRQVLNIWATLDPEARVFAYKAMKAEREARK